MPDQFWLLTSTVGLGYAQPNNRPINSFNLKTGAAFYLLHIPLVVLSRNK